MNEIKTSVKRTYSRVMIPSAVVVFAAIAIAQGQKDKAPGTNQAPDLLTTPAQRVPVVDTAPTDAPMSSGLASQVRMAGAELPVVDEPTGGWEQPPVGDPVSPLDSSMPGEYTLPAEDSVTTEPPPLLPDDSYQPLPEQSPDPSLPQPEGLYRSEGDGAASLAEYDPLVEPMVSADPSSPSPPALPDASDPALPENSYTDQPYEDPPQLPDVAAPPYEPDPMLPTGDAGKPSEGPSADLLPSEQPLEPVQEWLEPDVNPSSAAAVGAYQGSPIDAAPPAGVQPAPRQGAMPAESGQTGQVAVDVVSSMGSTDRFSGQATGKPGPQTLEGPQTPSLTLEKLVPPEVQVGLPAKFQVRVRNVGEVPAEQVLIRDEVPVGTNFVDASPQATRTADGAVYWEVGGLPPGEEVVVSMDVMPVTEGQVGSVATVSFQASATARSRSTKPELVLELTGPKQVLVGEPVRFAIKLSNPGTGAATQVVLEEDVPPGLSHSSGSRLEYEVGRIEPGQTRHLELTLHAAQPGQVLNTLLARADAGLAVKETVEMQVVAPKLQVGIEGPARRYLERQATFTVSVANPGTAPAHDVELVAQLPAGLKFVSTNNAGYYDQSRHSVIWSLQQLPAGEMGKAQFTAMPTDMGEQRVRAEGKAQMGLESSEDLNLVVEGIAALLFSVGDQMDPIEVGGQTAYEIKVVNQGSKAATNVRLAALVPDGMQPLGAKGPTIEQVQGQRVMFEPVSRLEPKQEATFRITVQGGSAGDHRFRVQLTSDEMSTPVTKEESTRVYED